MKQQITEINESINYHDEQEYEDECYDCHEYEFFERLECISGQYVRELWVALIAPIPV
jgi:hypothetical protein